MSLDEHPVPKYPKYQESLFVPYILKTSFFSKCLYRYRYPNMPPNPLQDNKILDWSKLKQIAHDILQSI